MNSLSHSHITIKTFGLSEISSFLTSDHLHYQRILVISSPTILNCWGQLLEQQFKLLDCQVSTSKRT